MGKGLFFTKVFNQLSDEELENYHRTVFLNMDGDFAEQKRLEYYQVTLKNLGQNVKIGRGVRFVNPQYISLADSVQIGDDCVLIATSERGINLALGARLKYGVYLDSETPQGYIDIGENVYIGTGCCLHGHAGLEIGEYSLLAQNITITPYSHKFDDKTKIVYSQGGYTGKVTIGRDCYLGMNVSVLHSGNIGEGSVVGAGSVVVHTIPPYSVAVGVPAKVIKKRGEKIEGEK